MKTRIHLLLVSALLLGFAGAKDLPATEKSLLYNDCARQNSVWQDVTQMVNVVRDGRIIQQPQVVRAKVAADMFGNANGNKFDLARDGAFNGATVAVLHFYTSGGFDFIKPKEWDTAGTARYVKNAAAWLTNVERFGEDRFGQVAEIEE